MTTDVDTATVPARSILAEQGMTMVIPGFLPHKTALYKSNFKSLEQIPGVYIHGAAELSMTKLHNIYGEVLWQGYATYRGCYLDQWTAHPDFHELLWSFMQYAGSQLWKQKMEVIDASFG